MFRLTGPGQVVILSREDDELCGHAKMFERPEPLLALLERHSIVVVRMQNQRRGLYVLRPFQRRAIPVQIELLEDIASEVTLVSVSSVARAVVTDEIHNAPKRHCGL